MAILNAAAWTRRAALSLVGFAGAGAAAQCTRAAHASPAPAARPDAELAAIVGQLKDAEHRYLAAVQLEEASLVAPPLAPIDDEIDRLVSRAAELRPQTDRGFADKGWVVLGYSDLRQSGDRVFRSLMEDMAERGRA